ncbi:MAG: hypothetical protein DRH12_08135 [Deltaproteobacteria bacterium]|nr:MAG: hypothetical protein DRH12_08135 [Deltaproteobacteria bacterium]
MHLKRWLTGIILAVVLVVPLFIGPKWPFHLVLAAISIVAMREIFEMFELTAPFALRLVAYLVSSCLFVAIFLGRVQYWPLIIAAWTLLPMIGGLFFYSNTNENVTNSVVKAVYAPCYIALPLALLAFVFRYPRGNLWVLFLFVAVFAGDTGAFYLGRLFGRHKLIPSISPGKTWEGAIGGIVCTVVAGLWFFRITGIKTLEVSGVVLLFTISIVAQLGDLAESLLKRTHGKKDSGSLLPGHGGILDRIDGLLFAVPVLYYYLMMN